MGLKSLMDSHFCLIIILIAALKYVANTYRPDGTQIVDLHICSPGSNPSLIPFFPDGTQILKIFSIGELEVLMANSFTQIYVHYIFTVKGRENALKTDIKERLYPYIVKMASVKKCFVISINGMEDHIHLLVRLHPEIAISDFAKFIKANSSRWANEVHLFPRLFYWQAGFGGFSVSHSILDIVKNYIEKQQEHHRNLTAREEFELFLKKHCIEFNPDYLPE